METRLKTDREAKPPLNFISQISLKIPVRKPNEVLLVDFPEKQLDDDHRGIRWSYRWVKHVETIQKTETARV